MGYKVKKSSYDTAGPKGFRRKGAMTSAGWKSMTTLKEEPQEKGYYNPSSMEGRRSPIGSKRQPTGPAALRRRLGPSKHMLHKKSSNKGHTNHKVQ